MENMAQADAATGMGKQYSLAKILGIWALAAIPMGILSWVVFPAVSPDAGSNPLAAGVTRIALLTGGFDLVVRPFYDHRPAGRGRSPLGDGQAQAPPQRAARS